MRNFIKALFGKKPETARFLPFFYCWHVYCSIYKVNRDKQRNSNSKNGNKQRKRNSK